MAPSLTETVACLLRAPLLLTPSYCGLLYMYMCAVQCVQCVPAVHVQVRGGRRHDGAVRGLEGHQQEERRGGVVTFYPGDCSPDITWTRH